MVTWSSLLDVLTKTWLNMADFHVHDDVDDSDDTNNDNAADLHVHAKL